MNGSERLTLGLCGVFLVTYVVGRAVDVAGGLTNRSLFLGIVVGLAAGALLGVLVVRWAERGDGR